MNKFFGLCLMAFFGFAVSLSGSAPSSLESGPSLVHQPTSRSTLALDRRGVLYSSENIHGENQFVQVLFPPGVKAWKSVSGGAGHVLAVSDEGKLFGWGTNDFGQAGGEGNYLPAPREIVVAGVTAWKDVSAGGSHSLALSENGEIFSWGSNRKGKLGVGDLTNQAIHMILSPTETNFIRAPQKVPTPLGVSKWLSVSAGLDHSLALADNGQIYAWGDNSRSQCGNNWKIHGITFMLTRSFSAPTLVPNQAGVLKWKSVVAGGQHSLAISEAGVPFGWGANDKGQCGIGGSTYTFMNVGEPTRVLVMDYNVISFDSLAAGMDRSMAFSTQGQLYTWGGDRPYATRLQTFPGIGSWRDASAGTEFMLALGDNCGIYLWGNTMGLPSTPTHVTSSGYRLELPVQLCAESPAVPLVQVRTKKVEAIEGDQIQFEVVRHHDASTPFTVYLDWLGSATPGMDYGQTPEQVEIPAGRFSTFFKVAITKDGVLEKKETLVADIRPHSSYEKAPVSMAEVVLMDSYPAPKTSVAVRVVDGVAIENPMNDTKNNAVFVVARDNTLGTSNALTIFYSLTGSATDSKDYLDLTGFVTIPAGKKEAMVVVEPIRDAIQEVPELVKLTVLERPSYKPGVPASAEIYIYDDENDLRVIPSVFQFDFNDKGNVLYDRSGHSRNADIFGAEWVADGWSGARELDVLDDAIYLPGGADLSVQSFTFTSWFKLNPNDGITPNIRTFFSTFTPSRNDGGMELNLENSGWNFSLRSGNSTSGYGFSSSVAGDTNSWHWVAMVHAINGTTRTLSMFVDGKPAGTINGNYFQQAYNNQPFWLGISGDRESTSSRNMNSFNGRLDEVQFHSRALSTNEVLHIFQTTSNRFNRPYEAPTLISLTVKDDQASEVEKSGEQDLAEFRITRSGRTDHEVKVYYSVGGSAQSGIDFEALPGEVTLSPGQTEALIVIRALDDAQVEDPESVDLKLVAHMGYEDGNSIEGTIVLLDNDVFVPPYPNMISLETPDKSSYEPDIPDQGTQATFVFTRSGPDREPLRVKYRIDGTAQNGVDYAPLSGEIFFPENATSVQLVLAPVEDSEEEGSETVILTLEPGERYGLEGETEGRVFIHDAESLPPHPTSAAPTEAQQDRDGDWKILFQGKMGQTYQIQASENLTDWVVLKTVLFTDPLFEFKDVQSRYSKMRFYRAIRQ